MTEIKQFCPEYNKTICIFVKYKMNYISNLTISCIKQEYFAIDLRVLMSNEYLQLMVSFSL
jgi:hypothetical protein